MFETNDMFLTIEKLEARTRELGSLRFVDLVSIAPMIAMEGQLAEDDVYRSMPEKIEGSFISIGDEFVGRDKYL